MSVVSYDGWFVVNGSAVQAVGNYIPISHDQFFLMSGFFWVEVGHHDRCFSRCLFFYFY